MFKFIVVSPLFMTTSEAVSHSLNRKLKAAPPAGAAGAPGALTNYFTNFLDGLDGAKDGKVDYLTAGKRLLNNANQKVNGNTTQSFLDVTSRDKTAQEDRIAIALLKREIEESNQRLQDLKAFNLELKGKPSKETSQQKEERKARLKREIEESKQRLQDQKLLLKREIEESKQRRQDLKAFNLELKGKPSKETPQQKEERKARMAKLKESNYEMTAQEDRIARLKREIEESKQRLQDLKAFNFMDLSNYETFHKLATEDSEAGRLFRELLFKIQEPPPPQRDVPTTPAPQTGYQGKKWGTVNTDYGAHKSDRVMKG